MGWGRACSVLHSFVQSAVMIRFTFEIWGLDLGFLRKGKLVGDTGLFLQKGRKEERKEGGRKEGQVHGISHVPVLRYTALCYWRGFDIL